MPIVLLLFVVVLLVSKTCKVMPNEKTYKHGSKLWSKKIIKDEKINQFFTIKINSSQ